MAKIHRRTIAAMLALLLRAASAHAQTDGNAPTVTFTNINDAVPGRFFDAATTGPVASDPNTLVIGFNSGMDLKNWKDRDFKSSLLPYSYPSATDTISFVIHAPEGYCVATVTYFETLVVGNSRTGRAFTSTQMVIDGIALQETFADLTGRGAVHVPMSITSSLVSANAEARLTEARVVVQLLPLPEPPTAKSENAALPVPPVPETPPVADASLVTEVPAADPPAVPDTPAAPETPAESVAPPDAASSASAPSAADAPAATVTASAPVRQPI